MLKRFYGIAQGLLLIQMICMGLILGNGQSTSGGIATLSASLLSMTILCLGLTVIKSHPKWKNLKTIRWELVAIGYLRLEGGLIFSMTFMAGLTRFFLFPTCPLSTNLTVQLISCAGLAVCTIGQIVLIQRVHQRLKDLIPIINQAIHEAAEE